MMLLARPSQAVDIGCRRSQQLERWTLGKKKRRRNLRSSGPPSRRVVQTVASLGLGPAWLADACEGWALCDVADGVKESSWQHLPWELEAPSITFRQSDSSGSLLYVVAVSISSLAGPQSNTSLLSSHAHGLPLPLPSSVPAEV